MKYAVVGLGKIGLSHLKALETAENCSLAAVCDINEEAAKAQSEKYNVPYFTDYKQIPGNCDADAVVLNLPHWLHCEVTEFFLDNGFHVLVEKPMANTPEECHRMLAAAQRSGKKLAVAHPQRFRSAYRKVKEIVESGEMGQLVMMDEFRCVDYFVDGRPKWFLSKKHSGGGIVMNYGAHALDKILYITGSKVKTVHSSIGNVKTDHDIEGHAQIFMKLENGVTATVSFNGYHVSEYENYYYFTNGAIKVRGGTHFYRAINGEWVFEDTPQLASNLGYELMEFEKFVRGVPSEIPSAEYGAEIIKTIDRIYSV